jgi:hypothetical protein
MATPPNFVMLACILSCFARPAFAAETVWIEAEHLDGIRGYCWPMGRPEMKKTDGHWGLSGPGWAAEWNMGGESGFLSIAAGAEDDRAVAAKVVEIPADGTYAVWVRYGEWREAAGRFQVELEQQGAPRWTGRYGERPMVDEDNEMKLYWGWVFTWDKREAALKKGPARLSLRSATKESVPRQVDVIVLTTDTSYRPQIKERPRSRAWAVLEGYRGGVPGDLEPLARNRPAFEAPPAWKPRTFRDKGFLYLWNMRGNPADNWLGDKPNRVKAPYHVAAAKTRRQLVEAFAPLTLAGNAAKYRKVYGRELDRNPYQDVIPCLSSGNIAFAPLSSLWGARTLGYESSAATSSLLPMRWAFLRGLARQGGHLTATYRSCNFGDSATIFSNEGSFHSPQNILDNYYSVYSGAGMTWYKFDIWYQYMAGASMFYHEQGFDEFWRPGGTSAAGVRRVELSPKGKLVDRFLRLTAAEADRGVPFTPVAFLVDYAHGWEPAPFWPNSFQNWHGHRDRFGYGDHERMLEEYFSTAYFPIGPESEKPITGTNEVYLAGPFGDIFDVVCAYPDVKRWTTLDTYPVVIAAGEIELTAAEGRRLAQYVADGGTLLVADGHLSGPGLAALELPSAGAAAEADAYCWLGDAAEHPSQRFRFRPIQGTGSARKEVPAHPSPARARRPLATAPDGSCFCAAFDRGRGRLVYLAVPYGMGIDRRAIPVLPRLMAHLTRGLMPIEVAGEVEWMVNRTSAGWAVTLLNPAGQRKPQQGIMPTDFRENRQVTIRARVSVQSARDRLLPADPLPVRQNAVQCEVVAGGLRIIELK